MTRFTYPLLVANRFGIAAADRTVQLARLRKLVKLNAVVVRTIVGDAVRICREELWHFGTDGVSDELTEVGIAQLLVVRVDRDGVHQGIGLGPDHTEIQGVQLTHDVRQGVPGCPRDGFRLSNHVFLLDKQEAIRRCNRASTFVHHELDAGLDGIQLVTDDNREVIPMRQHLELPADSQDARQKVVAVVH